MGWKGAIRSMGAAARRAERESRRRANELARQRQQHERMLEKEQAAHEVAVHENYLEQIVSVHTECSEPIDWEAIVGAPLPPEPEPSNVREQEATHRLESYEPSFFDRLLRKENSKRAQLRQQVYEARSEDKAEYQSAQQSFQEAGERRELATRILEKDRDACIEAIQELGAFAEIGQLGSTVAFAWKDAESPLEIELEVHSETVIPSESKSQLKSGKLSVKEMPKGQFYSLYQDYVCGAVLRAAREVFALLPLESVIVTASDDMLNTQTGHLEQQAILSAAILRATMEKLNFAHLDPSDAMSNFVHRMSFKKTKGFEPVERIEPEDVPGLGRGNAN